ncbi:MAG: hypothetical protein NTY02_08555, partial [Acidobacteria bacterium]|nr:hypothetical protein [Acidobacteriota bacterium]
SANPRIQREALHALAATSDRSRDLLARGIARSDDVRQAKLIELMQPLGAERAVPVLRHLLTLLDPRTIARPTYVAVIESLGRIRSDAAAEALALVFEPSLWRAPYRTLQFRMAAGGALRAMGGPVANAMLRDVSVLTGRRPAAGRAQGAGGSSSSTRTGAET